MAEFRQHWRKPFFVSDAADFEEEKSAFEVATGTHYTAIKTFTTFGRTGEMLLSNFKSNGPGTGWFEVKLCC